LNLKLGKSPIIVSLACSNNAIVERKPEQDPVEDVLMASLEDMAQPALMMNSSFKKRRSWQNLLS
jgi:hypothetical protein